MGKTWRRDSKNKGWRKAKQQKQSNKKRYGIKPPIIDEPIDTSNGVGSIQDYGL